MKFVLTFEKIDGEFCDRECPLFVLDAETDTPLCSLTSEKVVENEPRPDWCPLKKAPERKKAAYPTAYEKIDTPDEWEIYRTGFEDGSNDCLDVILGKEN